MNQLLDEEMIDHFAIFIGWGHCFELSGGFNDVGLVRRRAFGLQHTDACRKLSK